MVKTYSFSVCDCAGPLYRCMLAILEVEALVLKSTLDKEKEEASMVIQIDDKRKAIFERLSKVELKEVE